MKSVDVFSSTNPWAARLHRPFIIAEAGVNHEGSLNIAKRLIEEAKEGGADAIKFQTYRAKTLASKYSPAYWDTSKEPTLSQYELFSRHDKFWKKEMVALKEHCDVVDIEFMSTPFDIESATFLNDLMGVFKISSSDITNKPFIDFMCSFDKPIILSTGASHLWEIQQATDWIDAHGNSLALLHCVLNYPTPDENAQLGRIIALRSAFPGRPIGYSDHTLPKDMKVCEIAALLGATIIEKHFTHDKTLLGNDHYHAMDKNDLKDLLNNLDRVFQLLGNFKVAPQAEEEPARANARRSLVASRHIPAGKMIDFADLTFKRPAHGVSPKFIDEVVGRVASSEIPEDTVIKWNMLS